MEIKYLEVLVMPNGELLCKGKTVGWLNTLLQYVFTPEEVAERNKAK